MNSIFKITLLNSRAAPVRFGIALALILALLALTVGTLLSIALLMRLGWDALWSPSPAYLEAAKNFLLAFVGAFGAPFLVWRTWVAQQQAQAAAQQAQIALENHITGIFSKSVELMGL